MPTFVAYCHIDTAFVLHVDGKTLKEVKRVIQDGDIKLQLVSGDKVVAVSQCPVSKPTVEDIERLPVQTLNPYHEEPAE